MRLPYSESLPADFNPMRYLYLYLLFSGFLEEVFDRPSMLRGGPFDIERFPEAAAHLLGLVLKDPRISEAKKQAAQEHYEFCMSLYNFYRRRKRAPASKRTEVKYRKQREAIDSVARELAELKSA